MKITDLIGKSISVIPSYIDTFDAEILDTNGNYFILRITKISSHEKDKKLDDVMYFKSLLNFKIN
jgi:hypothetical protein